MSKQDRIVYYITKVAYVYMLVLLLVVTDLPIPTPVAFGLAILMGINDYFRQWTDKLDRYVVQSALVTIAICAYLFSIMGFFEFYYYFILFEFIVYYRGRSCKLLVGTHFLMYIVVVVLKAGDFMYIGTYMNLISYGLFANLYYAFRVHLVQKLENANLLEEMKEKNDQLARLNEEIEILTLEKERDRVSAELHDNMGQVFTGLILHLNYLEEADIKEEERQVIVSKLSGIAKDGLDKLRETVHELKAYAYMDLDAGLKLLFNDFERHTDLRVVSKVDYTICDRDFNRHIYFIIKESLTNAKRHGHADTAQVTLTATDETVHLAIEDDGYGAKNYTHGNGLNNIVERVEKLGGELKLSTDIGKGFKTEVIIGGAHD